MALIENKYFESTNVHVFPCAYRGTRNGNTIIDPESRMQTEANYTKVGGSNKTYVISYPTADTPILKVMIHGYYFEINNVVLNEIPVNSYLAINLSDSEIYNVNTQVYETAILQSFEENTENYLDTYIGTGTTLAFTGLIVTNDETVGTDNILIKTADWNQAALLPNVIKHGEHEDSIKIGLGLNTGKEQQIVIGHSNTEDSASDIIIADGANSNIKITSSNTNISNAELTLNGTDKINIESDTNVELKSSTNKINITPTDISATIKNKTTTLDGRVVLVDADNNLYGQAFNVSQDQTIGDAVEAITYVDSITYDSDGEIVYHKKPINIASGDSQGQIKVNGKNYDIKALVAQASPTFSSLSLEQSLTMDEHSDGIFTPSITLQDGTKQVSITQENLTASNKIQANYLQADTDIRTPVIYVNNNKFQNTDGVKITNAGTTLNSLDIAQASQVNLSNGTANAIQFDILTSGIYSSGFIKTKSFIASGSTSDSGIVFSKDETNKFRIFYDTVGKADVDTLKVTNAANTSTEYLTISSSAITNKIATVFEGNLRVSNKSATFYNSDNGVVITLDPDATNYKIAVNGSIKATKFVSTSDKRLKENITEYKANKSILELPVYKFDYIDGSKNNIGCLAQELKEICPEIVHEGNDGYLTIEESKLVYLLLDEVKKLKAKVELLKR